VRCERITPCGPFSLSLLAAVREDERKFCSSSSSSSTEERKLERMISSNHHQQQHWRSEEVVATRTGENSSCSPEFELIDNTHRRYNPIRLKCGVTVQLGENVLTDSPDIIDIMNHDLAGCLSVLPASVAGLIRRTNIWLNRSYAYGSIQAPTVLSHTTAHHFPGWLLW
jgi:hypothetical protein